MPGKFIIGHRVKLVDKHVPPEYEWLKQLVFGNELNIEGTITKSRPKYIRVLWDTGVKKRYRIKY